MTHENIKVYDESPEKSKVMDAEVFNEMLYKELDELEEVQRSTFLMRFKMDLSIKEIAEIHQCSEGTVKSRIFYTLKKLSEKLKMFDPNLSTAYER